MQFAEGFLGEGNAGIGAGECCLVCMRADYHINSESASIN